MTLIEEVTTLHLLVIRTEETMAQIVKMPTEQIIRNINHAASMKRRKAPRWPGPFENKINGLDKLRAVETYHQVEVMP